MSRNQLTITFQFQQLFGQMIESIELDIDLGFNSFQSYWLTCDDFPSS